MAFSLRKCAGVDNTQLVDSARGSMGSMGALGASLAQFSTDSLPEIASPTLEIGSATISSSVGGLKESG